MSATVIIPARYASTRFPGKPLASLLGKPMIRHVYERALEAERVVSVWVATDDERIADTVKGFGGKVIMTSPDHPNGTYRVIEAFHRVGGDPVINLQGDEPLIKAEQIDSIVDALERDPKTDVATLCVESSDPEEILSPHCVKVVRNHLQHALYFSRAPIPFFTEKAIKETPDKDGRSPTSMGTARIHVGLYGFRARMLKKIQRLPPSPWDETEKLEQLRWLYWGHRILVLDTSHRTIGIDVPEDIERAERVLALGTEQGAGASRRGTPPAP